MATKIEKQLIIVQHSACSTLNSVKLQTQSSKIRAAKKMNRREEKITFQESFSVRHLITPCSSPDLFASLPSRWRLFHPFPAAFVLL